MVDFGYNFPVHSADTIIIFIHSLASAIPGCLVKVNPRPRRQPIVAIETGGV